MRFARRVSAALIVWSLTFLFTVVARGAVLQLDAPEADAPTPIEQALMEHVCSVVPSGGAPESDRYLVCLRAQLLALRTDFGRYLSRLSAPERKALDAACNGVRTASGRDAYLDCLAARLTALRAKRSRGNPVAPLPAAPPPEQGQVSTPPVAPPVAQPAASRSWGLWIGVGVVIVLAAAGGVLFFLKTRRASHKCRVCGTDVPEAGALCQKCRHEAADAIRRAAAERAEQQRAQEEDARRQKEEEEEQRRQRAQREEEARLLQELREREAARKREDDERRRQEDEERQLRVADVSHEEFDPYAVLEIARTATADEIHAAYEGARVKCDPAQVSHLSDEVQEHFRAKSKAVERAHQMLTQ